MIGDQFEAKASVTDHDMMVWGALADSHKPLICPGHINWTMIVKSLIAEIKRLRGGKNAD